MLDRRLLRLGMIFHLLQDKENMLGVWTEDCALIGAQSFVLQPFSPRPVLGSPTAVLAQSFAVLEAKIQPVLGSPTRTRLYFT
jgi:hypothetical protein